MAFKTKYPDFLFLLTHYFLLPLADTISAKPWPENFLLGAFMFVQGG